MKNKTAMVQRPYSNETLKQLCATVAVSDYVAGDVIRELIRKAKWHLTHAEVKTK